MPNNERFCNRVGAASDVVRLALRMVDMDKPDFVLGFASALSVANTMLADRATYADWWVQSTPATPVHSDPPGTRR
jgi:hypothetical protein